MMEDIPKWKREAMDAIYGGKEPSAGGPKNEAAAMQAGVNKATATDPQPEDSNEQPDTTVDSSKDADATADGGTIDSGGGTIDSDEGTTDSDAKGDSA